MRKYLFAQTSPWIKTLQTYESTSLVKLYRDIVEPRIQEIIREKTGNNANVSVTSNLYNQWGGLLIDVSYPTQTEDTEFHFVLLRIPDQAADLEA